MVKSRLGMSLRLKKADAFAINFSMSIKKLADKDVDTNAYIDLFNKLLKQLTKRKLFVQDQDLWVELYKKALPLYNERRDIAGIPATLVTKHNNVLPFYMKQQFVDMTILHFDTHSDLNSVKGSSELPMLLSAYKTSGEVSNIDKAQEIVWDIGAAVSGVLFTTGIRDVVWCMPSWVPDKQLSLEYFIKTGKRDMTLCTEVDVSRLHNMDEWSTNKHKNQEKKMFSKLQTGRLTKKGLRNLIQSLNDKREYILDIDLDYFVCNGQGFSNKYWKESYDLQSHYRTEFLEFNQQIPRNKLDASTLKPYVHKVNRELHFVNKRIKQFLKLVKYLKHKGHVPSAISVCDSANTLFSDCEACNSLTNGYVPNNLALYVHSKVLSGLEKVFA